MQLLQFLFKVIHRLTDASTERSSISTLPLPTFSLVYPTIVAVLYLVAIELQELQRCDIKFERNVTNATKNHYFIRCARTIRS